MMEIKLDFEYLNKLSPKDYWDFVDEYVKSFKNFIIANEEDYMKKKDFADKTITPLQRIRMRRAVNWRKNVRMYGDELLKLNFNKSPLRRNFDSQFD